MTLSTSLSTVLSAVRAAGGELRRSTSAIAASHAALSMPAAAACCCTSARSAAGLAPWRAPTCTGCTRTSAPRRGAGTQGTSSISGGAVAHLARAAEHLEGRHRPDTALGRGLLVRVHIHLAKDGRRELARELLEGWSDCPARTAPRRSEVDDNRRVASLGEERAERLERAWLPHTILPSRPAAVRTASPALGPGRAVLGSGRTDRFTPSAPYRYR